LQTELAKVNAGIKAAKRVVAKEAARHLKLMGVDKAKGRVKAKGEAKDRVAKKLKPAPAAPSPVAATPGRLEAQSRAFRELQSGARGNGRVELLLRLYRGTLSCPRCRRAARKAKGGSAHTHKEGCVLEGTAKSHRGFASA